MSTETESAWISNPLKSYPQDIPQETRKFDLRCTQGPSCLGEARRDMKSILHRVPLSPLTPIPRAQAPQHREASLFSRAERQMPSPPTSPEGKHGETTSGSLSNPTPPHAQHGQFDLAHTALGAAPGWLPTAHPGSPTPAASWSSSPFGPGETLLFGFPLAVKQQNCCPSCHPSALNCQPRAPLMLETALKTRLRTNNWMVAADVLPQHRAESAPGATFLSSANRRKERGCFS